MVRAIPRPIAVIVALTIAAMAALSSQAQQGQEPQFVPGTGVGLVPMEGFSPSDTFAGFESQTGGSILVDMLPAKTYSEMAADADVNRLRRLFGASGVRVESATPLSVAGSEGLLLRGSQEAANIRYRKWIALIQDENTVMLTVQAPESGAPDDASVLSMLSIVTLGASPSIAEQVAALPFSLTVTDPFRPRQRRRRQYGHADGRRCGRGHRMAAAGHERGRFARPRPRGSERHGVRGTAPATLSLNHHRSRREPGREQDREPPRRRTDRECTR